MLFNTRVTIAHQQTCYFGYVNEYNSASQDISSLPALANVQSEEPPAYSTDGPDSAASETVEGSGDVPRVSPPSEPLVECASCPCTSTPLLLTGDPALWGRVTEQLRE